MVQSRIMTLINLWCYVIINIWHQYEFGRVTVGINMCYTIVEFSNQLFIECDVRWVPNRKASHTLHYDLLSLRPHFAAIFFFWPHICFSLLLYLFPLLHLLLTQSSLI